MNRIQIIGRLTANPELKSTSNGTQVCTFTVAVSRRFNREETDFFPVTVWRETAVHCNKYLTKGSQVAVCGELQIRRYDDKNGSRRIAVDLQADEVEFIGMKSNSKDNQSGKSSKPVEQKQVDIDSMEECDDDDMPF